MFTVQYSMISSQAPVTEFRQNDVMLGRGSGPNEHIGNIRFRQLVADRKEEYLHTRNRQKKAKIAREIVKIVTRCKGRFLRKIEFDSVTRHHFKIPKSVKSAWVIVDDATKIEKAKQALRQSKKKNTKKGEREKIDGSGASSSSSVTEVRTKLTPPDASSAAGGLLQLCTGTPGTGNERVNPPCTTVASQIQRAAFDTTVASQTQLVASNKDEIASNKNTNPFVTTDASQIQPVNGKGASNERMNPFVTTDASQIQPAFPKEREFASDENTNPIGTVVASQIQPAASNEHEGAIIKTQCFNCNAIVKLK